MRPLAFKLLRLLSDQHFISGSLLAGQLHVSRSAISDALMEASAQGVEIFKLTRRGYRLAAPIDLLDLDVLRTRLGADARRVDIEILEVVGSTNSELAKRAALGAPSGSCIAAEVQTAGRGRRGRQWQSGLATSLTFSLLWRFERGASHLGGLSLLVGLSIVRAMHRVGARNVRLKWPNDIVIEGRKLGGVLIETQGDMLGPTTAVIGIGINVDLPERLRTGIEQPAVDLRSQLELPLARSELLAEILHDLIAGLAQFSESGFSHFREEWIACHALHNRSIWVLPGHGDAFEAIVRDVALDGSLIVDCAAGRTLLSSGEISVRELAVDAKKAIAAQVPRDSLQKSK